jgi:hypothetical protein
MARRKETIEAKLLCERNGPSVDMFVVVNGKRIAKRGHPGTRHAMTWIPLEPGFTVTSPPDHSSLMIEYSEPDVQ